MSGGSVVKSFGGFLGLVVRRFDGLVLRSMNDAADISFVSLVGGKVSELIKMQVADWGESMPKSWIHKMNIHLMTKTTWSCVGLVTTNVGMFWSSWSEQFGGRVLF